MNLLFKRFLMFKNIYCLWFLFEFNLGIFWSIWSVNVVDQGHSYQEASIALALYLLVIACLETPTGWLADRYGHKSTTIAGIIFSTLGFFALSFAASNTVLYSSLAMAALGMSFLNGSKQVWFIDTAQKIDPKVTKERLLIDLEVPRRISQITGAYIGTGLNQIHPSLTWYSVALSGLIAFVIALRTPSNFQFCHEKVVQYKNGILKQGPYTSIKNIGLPIIYLASFLYGIDLAIRGLILSPYVIKILNSGSATSMGTVTLVGASMGLAGNKFYKWLTIDRDIDKTIFLVITLVVYSFSESVFFKTNSFLVFLLLYGASLFTMGWFVALHDAIVLDFIDDDKRAIHLSMASSLRNTSAAVTLMLLAPQTTNLSVLRNYWQYAATALLACAFLYQVLYLFRRFSPVVVTRKSPNTVRLFETSSFDTPIESKQKF